MAGTNREARLNLVITARDEAKQVVEGLVTSLNEAFDGLGAKLVEKMGLNDLKEAVTSATTPIKNDLKAISKSLNTAGQDASSAGKSIKTAMNETKAAVNELKTPLTSDMAEMIDAISRVEAEFASEAREAKSASTEIETALKAMAESATSASETLKSDLSGVTASMDKVAERSDALKKSIDFANLQIAGQQIQQWGDSIVGFFNHAANSAAGFDQNIHNTVASLDFKLPEGLKLTKDQIQDLVDVSEKYGTEGFFPANQIAEGLSVLANQGMSFAGIMGGTIQTVHDVAAANQQDFADTANVMTDISNEMHEQLKRDALKTAAGQAIMKSALTDSEKDAALVASQMPRVGDAMTAALHSGRMTMQDFLTTMKYVGPQAGALGVDFGDLAASIALLTQHGIKGSQAGTALRRELTNLLPQSKNAADAMQKLGLSADGVTSIFFGQDGAIRGLTDVQRDLHNALAQLNPAQQELATKAIFGQYALAAMTVTAHEAPDAFKKLSEQMHQTGITTEILAEKKNGLLIIMNSVKATFDMLTKKIGEDFKPQIIAITGFLQGLMRAWDGLNPSVRKTIESITLGTGVFMAVSGAALTFAGTIGMLIPGVVEAGALIGELAVPIGVTILAIGAIGAAVFGLKIAWDRDLGGIQEKTKVACDWIAKQFDAAVAYISPLVAAFVDDLKKWWNDISESFGKAVHNIYSFLVWLKPLWAGTWEVVKGVAKAAIDVIGGAVKGTFDAMTGIINLFIHFFSGEWGKMWDDVKRVSKGATEATHGILKGFFDAVKGILKGFDKLLGGLPSKAFDWGKNVISMFVDGIKSMISSVEEAVTSVASKVSGFLGFHSPTKEGPASDSDTWMPNLMNMLTQGIVDNTPKIEAAVGNVALGLKTSVGGITNVNNSPLSLPNMAGRQIVVTNYINIDGRSVRSDDELAEKIAQKFRTQMAMAVG